MRRLHMALLYVALFAVVSLGIWAYGRHQAADALRDQRIEELRVERDSAEIRYQRAKQAVVHDTVVVRQAIADWKAKSEPVRKAIESGVPGVPVATVTELLDRGDSLASQCAQFITHTEALVQSADTLNLAAKAEIRALGKRKPSKIGQVAKGTVLVLAGVGLGVILF